MRKLSVSLTQGNTLHLFVSNGMKGSVEALPGQCEKEVGRRLAIQFGSNCGTIGRCDAVRPAMQEAGDDLCHVL